MDKRDIFNRALGLIGHDRTVAPDDTESTEYIRCQREWDAARLSVLQANDDGWAWLVNETPLQDGAECPCDGWAPMEYRYERPESAIRIIAVLLPNSRRAEYRALNNAIVSTHPTLKIRYVADEEDPSLWPPAIQDAVVAELASRIVYPMSADPKTMQIMKGLAITTLAEAIKRDADESRTAGSDGKRYMNSRR